MLKITRAKIIAHRFLFVRNKTALTKLKSVANGSIQWRGRSYAASVPSDVPKPQTGRKKVSKDERKAMVEAFVKTYRAAHDGKFPTASVLKKNVRGSYYVIRIMLQELEFKSKTSSAQGGTETVGNRPSKEHEVTMDVGPQNEVDIVPDDNMEIGDASDGNLKAEGSPLASVAERNSFDEVEKPTALGGQPDPFGVNRNLINENNKGVIRSNLGNLQHEKIEGDQESPTDFVASERHPVREATDKTFPQDHDTAENWKKEEAERVSSYSVATESHSLKQKMEKISHPSFGNADEKEERVPPKNLSESDGTKHEAEQDKGSPESVKNEMDVSHRQTDEAEVPRKSTLWGNLKSLADGFFRMWK